MVMGLCEAKTGIEPFGRLVEHVMKRPGSRSADRVFWVVDNGSSHRGEASVKRMREADLNALLVHLPVHASWLNQGEVSFSLLQRKVLTPNDSTDLPELELRIKLYEDLTNKQPKPFDWRFTKYDLFDLLQRLARREAAARRSYTTPPAGRG
jgi:DDE superfamily endonuclease